MSRVMDATTATLEERIAWEYGDAFAKVDRDLPTRFLEMGAREFAFVSRAEHRALTLDALKAIRTRDDEWSAERAKGWTNYCRHGRYIGDPYGADYLCGACEDGADPYAEASVVGYAAAARLDQRRRLALVRYLAIEALDVEPGRRRLSMNDALHQIHLFSGMERASN